MQSKLKETSLNNLFFAYQGAKEGVCDNNVDSIKRAISDFNTYQKSIYAISWEDLKQSGSFIDKEILKTIDESNLFACDLTYLNHNVLFELGYAISKNRSIFIFLNEDITNAKNNYLNFFLKNVKYSAFKNSKNILSILQNKEYSNEHIKKVIPQDNLNVENDIFYLENESESQASLDLNDFMNSLNNNDFNLKVKFNDPYEVDYQPLSYYFKNLYKAKAIIFHMLPITHENHFMENAKKSFLAGIACGLDKDVLIIAPAKFRSPLDYADISIDYISPEDCLTKVQIWVKNHCSIQEIQEIEEQNIVETSNIDILKIALECTAENEKEDLLNYFISTNAYEKAKDNKSKLLLIGRKGAGKTAIYYKLLNDLSEDNLNYNVNLKPDSLELLENIDFSALYKSESSKKTFFYTVWKTVIYSKLIQVISSRIISKDTKAMILTEEENQILDFCQKYENLIKQNFFGIIKEINNISEKGLDSPNLLEDLYKNYLTPLTNLLKKYFQHKKYVKLNILSDNLDKSWNPQSSLLVQSDMILTLLEVDSIIKNELANDNKDNISVFNYIFLREDIYNYVSNVANEPDKLRTISFKINWEDSPIKLKQLVELKLKHILSKEENATLESLWNELFEGFSNKQEPFDVIKNIIILRPRDIIFFIQSLFESAANNERNKVSSSDFEYAMNQYTEFLNGNLIAETKAEFPDISEILRLFQLYHIMRYRDYVSKLKSSFNYDEKQIEDLTRTLFKNGYLIAMDKTSKKMCIKYEELEHSLSKRRFYIVRNNVVLMVNNRYLSVKSYFRKMF